VGTFRARPCAIGLLAALAACGRVGYERVMFVDEQPDGSSSLRDAPEATGEVTPPDAQPPDAQPADVRDGPAVPDAASPDLRDAFTVSDGSPPLDVGATPTDVGVDSPSARIVVATSQNATLRRGGAGPGVVDVCPADRLLIGFEGTHSPSSGSIRSLVGVCATVTLPLAGAPATPWQLTRLPPRGDASGDPWSRLCPDRHVLVGFDGNAGSAVGQLVFVCAPISLAPSGSAVVLGSDTELDDVGVQTGTDFPQTDCPGGQAARGAEIRAGSVLEAFGLICSTLGVR
jgi:hypothetical protein